MNFPVFVEQSNGEYIASLGGNSSLRVARPTREAAIAAVRSEIVQQLATGQMVAVDVPNTSQGIEDLAVNFPITVEQSDGGFVAVMFTRPSLCVSRPTREAAVADVRRLIADEIRAGRLTAADAPPGLLALAGRFADDPTLQDICDEIYRERDAEPKE